MVRDRCNCYFSFWAIFCPFTPPSRPSPTAQKIKILKKWKFFLEISSFYICVPIIMIRWCMVPEIWCVTCNCYFSFWAIFYLFTPLTAQKINILKKLKKQQQTRRFHHFTYVYQKLRSDDVWFLRYGVRPMDRQMDRRMEKVTYRGGCPT